MSLRPFLSLFSISSPSRCTAFNHLCLLSHFPRFSSPGSSFILLLPPLPGILSQLSSLVLSSFYSASTYLTPPLASPVSLFSLSLSRLPSPNVAAALTNFIRGMAVAATAPRLNEIIHCRTCSCEIIHGTMCVCACIYGCACESVSSSPPPRVVLYRRALRIPRFANRANSRFFRIVRGKTAHPGRYVRVQRQLTKHVREFS